MGLFSFLGWVIKLMMNFVFERIEDVFIWVLPSYMTVMVIKDSKVEKYANFLSFWTLLALILGVEYLTFGLFYNLTLYRVVRLVLMIYLQLDSCHYAKTAFDALAPFISKKHEQQIEEVLGLITSKIDEQGGKIREKAQGKFWQLVQQNYELIKQAMFSAWSAAQSQAVNLAATNSNASSVNGEQDEDASVQKKES